MARSPGHPAPQKNRQTALTPDEADRYRLVVELRRNGWTFDEIAEHVGYADRAGAKRAYDSALKRWGAKVVDDLRVSEGERLDQLWRRVITAIAQLGADAEPKDLTALMNTAVKVSSARRQLFGLDVPRSVELTGANGGPIELDMSKVLFDRIRSLAVEESTGVVDAEVVEDETDDGQTLDR